MTKTKNTKDEKIININGLIIVISILLCLYFMGLNLSNNQISKELDLCQSDTQYMATKLREGITVKLEGKVEFDEVYIVAGHKKL